MRVRAKGAGEKTQPKKEKTYCELLCGVHNQMTYYFCTSPDSSSADFILTRWAYPDGSGSNCHACERVWQTELSHHWHQRDDYKIACANDLELLKSHRERRMAWVTRKKTACILPMGGKPVGSRRPRWKPGSAMRST